MTIPSIEDVEKTLSQNLTGKFIYSNLVVKYDFTDVFSELELEPKFPVKLMLSTSYFINKQASQSKHIEIQVQ